MKNNESQEMYLETILLLTKRQANVRAVDICLERNLAKSSVSKAINLLVKNNLVDIDEHGYIILTESGLKLANKVYYKHNIITEALIRLGASEEVANDNACRIEHVITDEIFELLIKYIESTRK